MTVHMASSIGRYFAELSLAIGDGWNAFWFRARGGWHLELLRILVGALTLIWLASFCQDLVRWFGARGMLPADTVYRVLTGGNSDEPVYGFSHLFFVESAAGLWVAHGLAMAVALLFTLGVAPRLTGPLAALVVLAYVHRAPLVTGPFELVLSMLLIYLCLAPTGRALSVGRRRADAGQPTVMANVATRLMQVHLAALYLMMGLTKLGNGVWWTGDASWQLIAQGESRLVDLSFLRQAPLALDALTHGWVLFDLLYGVLIWQRLARPLLIAVSCLVWIAAALLTGRVGLAAVMIVANLAFIPSAEVVRWMGSRAEIRPAGEKVPPDPVPLKPA